MKKLSLLIILLLLILAIIGMFKVFKYKVNKDLAQPVYTPTKAAPPTPSPVAPKSKTSLSLFVPYWGLTDDKIESGKYDQIIYFGISPTQQDESQLDNFNEIVPQNAKKLLALRMTNNQENFAILKDASVQQKVIQETINIAKKNNMQGIVLDLEISAIPFDSLVKQINSFDNTFAATAKKNNLTFSLTLYGDALYRARPYDAKTLARNADTIMIMAYDFSKSKGNPGPNFPLNGSERFGYDLVNMTDDFLQFIPPEKISVIFGLFGYDWVVDEKDNALEQAQALTLLQIKQKFIDKCEFSKCIWKRDKESAETTVFYTDNDGKKHIVWFEDMESIKQKQEFLRDKGINSFSYWAYSYF
jgi:spore germination protein YaaH